MLAVLVAQDAKEVTKEWTHRWAGAKAGSSVTFETVSLVPGMGQDGKMTANEVKSTRVETVAKIDGERVTVEIAEGDAKQSQVFFVGHPSEHTGKVTKLANEEVKVGERAYACEVYEIVQETAGVAQVYKVWKCAGAPRWAVKETWTQSMRGKAQAGWVEELTGTESLKVGGRS